MAKNPRGRRSIASTTKLMTALLTLERTKPGQVFAGTDYQPAAVESKINLAKGERMRVGDLLEALLLESANDGAVALAEGVSGSREAFVKDMNARARRARPARHQLRQPDRPRRPGQLLDGGRSGHADPAADAQPAVRVDRAHAQRELESGSRPAHGEQPQRAGREGVPPVTGGSRRATPGPPATCWWARPAAPAAARVISVVLGRAQRGRARRRLAGRPALGSGPVPARGRAQLGPPGGPRGGGAA